jgi:hypothetical protein
LPSEKRFFEESEGIADRLRGVVERFLNSNRHPKYNDILEEVFGEYAIGPDPPDRSMAFHIADLEPLSPEFFRVLQEQVLAEYPLWRLIASCEGEPIVIYRQGVSFDDEDVFGVFEENNAVYLRWMNKQREMRETRNGALRRQLGVVRGLIPQAMAKTQTRGFHHLATFDQYQPHFPGLSVWILQTQGQYDLGLDYKFCPIRTSAVDDQGKLYPQYCRRFSPYTDLEPRFWAITYVVEEVNLREFDMVDKKLGIVGKICISDVIRDEELKGREHEAG